MHKHIEHIGRHKPITYVIYVLNYCDLFPTSLIR